MRAAFLVSPLPTGARVSKLTKVSRRGDVHVPQACGRDRSVAFVLSHFEARDLLHVRKSKDQGSGRMYGSFSVDLGMRSLDSIMMHEDGIGMSGDEMDGRVVATWENLKKMSKKGKTGAYEVYADGEHKPVKIAGISEETNMATSLLPVARGKPPTLILGGFGMHRMKDTDPGADTASKLAAVGRGNLRGKVLDICTGLGYTAIEAARSKAVGSVVTIERDDAVVQMQERNPWSQELFTNAKIMRHVGNAVDVMSEFGDGSFDVVVHDPPALALGGELYGLGFYKEICRVCVGGATLFHYIGDPSSGESGRLFRGVRDRLERAGFHDVTTRAEAFGVTATSR